VTNFGFEIVDDSTRDTGDRFIKCRSANGIPVNISGPLDGQVLSESDSGPNLGLEHFGFDVDDIETELQRLASVGANLVDGPNQLPDGTKFCWVSAPDNVRVELIQWPNN
tara:strand:+ start:1113 stop:1442 length:330 start_codon:yes stop_codon:yes gene_type:complete